MGEGTSASVYRGFFRGQDVAIKVIDKFQDKENKLQFEKELEVMRTVRSPFVVCFLGACLSPKLCMVFELCHKGSLTDYLQKEQINWDFFFNSCRDILRGVGVLHMWKPQIVHRDLKSLNFLVKYIIYKKVTIFISKLIKKNLLGG